jgi:hypothetical protein
MLPLSFPPFALTGRSKIRSIGPWMSSFVRMILVYASDLLLKTLPPYAVLHSPGSANWTTSGASNLGANGLLGILMPFSPFLLPNSFHAFALVLVKAVTGNKTGGGPLQWTGTYSGLDIRLKRRRLHAIWATACSAYK